MSLSCTASPERALPGITVLLGLYNGGADLGPQLQSYLDQTLKPSRILASDDGSEDDSRTQFDAFSDRAAAQGITGTLCEGPGRGLTANFLSLLARTNPDADYTALSDQDDIWLPGKLEQAVALLAPYGTRPALLGTRSWEWQPDTDQRQLSRPIPGPLDFTHALAQNFAGGNTMVLNRAALALVQRALPDLPEPAVHDWWLYQLISGAGGAVLLDDRPQLLYRQHHGNQIGANSTLRSKLRRFGAMLGGTYRQWTDQNIAALQARPELLTPEARALLDRLARDRRGPLPARLALLRDTGLHRKGRVNQATLWLAAALGKL